MRPLLPSPQALPRVVPAVSSRARLSRCARTTVSSTGRQQQQPLQWDDAGQPTTSNSNGNGSQPQGPTSRLEQGSAQPQGPTSRLEQGSEVQQSSQRPPPPPTDTAAQFLASITNPGNVNDKPKEQDGSRKQVQPEVQGSLAATEAEGVGNPSGVTEQSPFCFTADESPDDIDPEKILFAQTVQSGGPNRVFPYLRAEDAWAEFEKRLEADLQTVANTLLALFAVVSFWRGIWALLDYVFGDNPLGDFVCMLMGLGIILYIRLTGLRIGNFWPSL